MCQEEEEERTSGWRRDVKTLSCDETLSVVLLSTMSAVFCLYRLPRRAVRR